MVAMAIPIEMTPTDTYLDSVYLHVENKVLFKSELPFWYKFEQEAYGPWCSAEIGAVSCPEHLSVTLNHWMKSGPDKLLQIIIKTDNDQFDHDQVQI